MNYVFRSLLLAHLAFCAFLLISLIGAPTSSGEPVPWTAAWLGIVLFAWSAWLGWLARGERDFGRQQNTESV